MLTDNSRWSHPRDNQVVPSPWQATARLLADDTYRREMSFSLRNARALPDRAGTFQLCEDVRAGCVTAAAPAPPAAVPPADLPPVAAPPAVVAPVAAPPAALPPVHRARPGGVAAGVAVVLALVAGGLFLTRDGDGNGPVLRFDSATQMADRIGCTATFAETTAYAGVRSAGTCTSGGHDVLLRVVPGTEASYAWLDGWTSGQPDSTGAVGDGWVMVMVGQDREAFNAAFGGLTAS